MALYQVYCLDLKSSKVETKEIEAASDGDAIHSARMLQGLRNCEVWRDRKLIAVINSFSPDASICNLA